ncbi:hypothetical protein CDD83_10139 [Cordyceps sp. RAO-2017]|nr:hypothetical protein CDD83_10139 [Cordyceps sp. RAO-2017]
MARNDCQGRAQHPGVLHLYIHVMEMWPTPEEAIAAANVLSTLYPDAGQLRHMPEHIYVLCGHYSKVKKASESAIHADEAYAAYASPDSFQVAMRCHDLHLMMSTCLFLGQCEPTMAATDRMRTILPA